MLRGSILSSPFIGVCVREALIIGPRIEGNLQKET